MIVKKKELPAESVLKKEEAGFDYIDSFQSDFAVKQNDNLSEVARLFFTSSSPRWVDILFSLRNRIVKIFGLKVPSDITSDIDNRSYEKGEQIGIFKIFDKTENELILGENDKHLDFKVSLLVEGITESTAQKMLSITTLVKYNNWFGRLYFLPVQFFHRLIVQRMLKRIIEKLES